MERLDGAWGWFLDRRQHEHARGESVKQEDYSWCLWLVDAQGVELLEAGRLGVSCLVYLSVCVLSSRSELDPKHVLSRGSGFKGLARLPLAYARIGA